MRENHIPHSLQRPPYPFVVKESLVDSPDSDSNMITIRREFGGRLVGDDVLERVVELCRIGASLHRSPICTF